MSTQKQDTPSRAEVSAWLYEQLAKAERALRCREEGERVWRSGTDKSWAEVAKLHPSTAKAPPITKAQRLKNSASEARIAAWCRRDVEMWKVLLSLWSEDGKG